MVNPNGKKWKEKFIEIGAYWKHDENHLRPHALLTGDDHSNGFFNGSLVIERPLMLEQVCHDLLFGFSVPIRGLSRVVGSANGATTIPHEIAKRLGLMTGFTEKEMIDGEKEMLLKRFNVREGDGVLVCEDVLTTGGTTQKTIASLEEVGAEIFHKILVLVNRSGLTHLDGREIVALIDDHMPKWAPEDCPYCKMGSEAIRPKGNWDLLNAEY